MQLDPSLAYIIGAVSGLLFAGVSWKTGRGIAMWGICGAIFGVVTATVIMGLAHAAAVPYSDEVTAKYYWTSGAVSMVLIVLTAIAAFAILQRSDKRPTATSTGQEPVKL